MLFGVHRDLIHIETALLQRDDACYTFKSKGAYRWAYVPNFTLHSHLLFLKNLEKKLGVHCDPILILRALEDNDDMSYTFE